MGVRDLMARVDRRIFNSQVVRATSTFGDTSGVEGAFFKEPREIELPGGSVMRVGLSFDCQYVPEIADLAINDDFTVDGEGTFRFLRELLPGGNESGMTTIELGEKL